MNYFITISRTCLLPIAFIHCGFLRTLGAFFPSRPADRLPGRGVVRCRHHLAAMLLDAFPSFTYLYTEHVLRLFFCSLLLSFPSA